MKNLIIVLAFVSSCGPLKMDTAKAWDFEAVEALEISLGMWRDGESCDDITDFLMDTALDHRIDPDTLCE